MGCYGAIVAIRIGAAFSKDSQARTDVVHTELCSLHCNPSLHRVDQLVGQSLFADGFIKYSIHPNGSPEVSDRPALRILATEEQIIRIPLRR